MRSLTKWFATAAIVASVGVAAGAQFATAQDDPPPPPPQPTPVCELVTKDEATAALGDAVVMTDAGRSCAFTVAHSADGFRSLSVGLGPDGVTAALFAEGMRGYAEVANVTLRQVHGTGDEAWVTLDDRVSQLVARRGERFVSIIFVNVKTPFDERIATMAELARKSLSRVG